MQLEPVIGLEIHVQLKTKSKMFCGCSNISDDTRPNSVICPICTGHPGTLPTLNSAVLECATKLALALNLKINSKSVFERKNYFYPDLPNGYQISQFEYPYSENGFLMIYSNNKKVKIGIERLHIENDTAKNFHKENYSLIDFNRAGTPLAEIVTYPQIKSPEDAKIFLQNLRQICRYLDVSDADMERGHLRCDVNISLRPIGDKKLYPKTEVKNLNSFRSVERALKYEIQRQTKLWESLQTPKEQSTVGWDENKQITVLQRFKEESNDYRYFEEPDLKPLYIDKNFVKNIKNDLVELPYEKIQRFIRVYYLDYYLSEILTSSKELADYFEAVILEVEKMFSKKKYKWQKIKKDIIKLSANWISSELFKLMNANSININNIKISPNNFALFIILVFDNKINSSNAQKVLLEMFNSGINPEEFMQSNDLSQISDSSHIEKLVLKIIEENKDQVEQYKNGKENLMKYFIGVAMKQSKGKANPVLVEKLLKDKLK